MARFPEDADPAAAGPAAWWADFRGALALLTRLPVRPPPSMAIWPRACRTFPLAGTVVGLVGAIAFAIAVHIGLPVTVAAIAALAATMLLTGALHEDGLADMADGFGGGDDREAKLTIMRDSRIGAYGVLALVLTTLGRIAALVSLGLPGAAAALVAAHALSRGALPAVMHREATARTDGLGASVGRPSAAEALWAAGTGAVVALLALGPGAGLAAILAAAAASLVVAGLARQQIGGYTGDTLGATQQSAELAVLLAAAAAA